MRYPGWLHAAAERTMQFVTASGDMYTWDFGANAKAVEVPLIIQHAMLGDEKRDALLEKAFGKKLGGDGGEKRDRAGSVLAKYAPVSAAAPEEEKEDEVMADADQAEASDSDEEDQE